jgi:aspartate kinase
VIKFGGTSVGTPAALEAALGIAAAAARESAVVVVVSALAGVTDALDAAATLAEAGGLDAAAFAAGMRTRHLDLLGAVAPDEVQGPAGDHVRRRTDELEDQLAAIARRRTAATPARAAVLAAGERLSAPIAAAGLRARGVAARAVDAAGLLRTDAAFTEANVDMPVTRRLARAALAPDAAAVPVVTGFIGGTSEGETTLLGRGGSDLTASLLGWALDAERVEIWSDVDGVMTGDPRHDRAAHTLPRLTYEEAAALARAGAKVLHPRTLGPVAAAGIPVLVRNTLRPDGTGTWIGWAPPSTIVR